MPAMHNDVLENMESELERKFQLMLRLLSFEMTHEECISLVAPSEHIPILKQAAKFANIQSSQDWMSVQIPADIDGITTCMVRLRMRTHAQKEPPLSPRTPWWQFPIEQGTFDAGEKVISWMNKRYVLGRRFGTAQHVLRSLNKECDNGHQLRFMLPAILHLCKPGLTPRMDKWVEKHAAYTPCRHTPALSPLLKEAVRDTSSLLTSACLIGDDIPEPILGEVEIAAWSIPTFMLGTAIVSRM